MQVTRHHSCRVSPFGHPRIHARLTAPRGISQPPTSFIGSQCQGIHHAPLYTYNTKNHYREKLHHNKPHPPAPGKPRKTSTRGLMLATTIHKSNTTPRHQDRATTNPSPPTPLPNQEKNQKPAPTNTASPRACCLRTQQCVRWPPLLPPKILAERKEAEKNLCPSRTHQTPTTGTQLPNPNHRHPTNVGTAETPHKKGASVLLRKEVIQPHLPVRLPCYDFVPIADPTFDGSLPEGLGHRLRVLPTFMT